MTDHNPSKAHWGSQVDLTYLHGCRVSFYAQTKGFVHPLFGWISYKVWPQVSNGASTPLKQEEKTPLFRLKGVVVTFYGSFFNPLPPFSVTQPWHLFFPQPLWNCRVTSLTHHFEWDSLPFEGLLSMTDGQELTGRLGAHQSCQGALQGADSGEGFADLLQRQQRHVSLKDSHTPHWDTARIPVFLMALFLIKGWVVHLLPLGYFQSERLEESVSS